MSPIKYNCWNFVKFLKFSRITRGKFSLSLFQDADPREQHRDGARGVAAGLHAPRVPLPRGVRRHPQEDRDPQEVTSQVS